MIGNKGPTEQSALLLYCAAAVCVCVQHNIYRKQKRSQKKNKPFSCDHVRGRGWNSPATPSYAPPLTLKQRNQRRHETRIHRTHTATVNDDALWAPCVSEGDDVQQGDVNAPPMPVLQRPQDYRQLANKQDGNMCLWQLCLFTSLYGSLLLQFRYGGRHLRRRLVAAEIVAWKKAKRKNKGARIFWRTASNVARLPTGRACTIYTLHTHTHNEKR